ncbi:hypothetical protein U5801_06245 [Lamprobacter modestohalophilus]|uniref:hypothetical protein n=1 Tax=Lamprobacter modestohalophilus TaxID=1064514 RepID=UPI002ADEC6D9|nr:hypothetical protein [Lamprobacter modestohalophilus]MEA1049403.1 hypothetical protein [Lamprobacter modestohalophilus]
MNEKETLARTFIYRMRLEKVAAALSVVTLACGALPAAASLVTVQQTLEGSYSYIPICTSFDEFGACTSYPDDRDPTIDKTISKLTSSALQQRTKLEPNDVLGADEVVAEWTIDVDNSGQIKTYSNRVQPCNDVALRSTL